MPRVNKKSPKGPTRGQVKDGVSTVDLTLHLHFETKIGKDDEGALNVSDDGNVKNARFIPKSQIAWEEIDKVTVKIECPEWIAKREGFI